MQSTYYTAMQPSKAAFDEFSEWLTDKSKHATDELFIELLQAAENARDLGESCVTFELTQRETQSGRAEVTTFRFEQFDWREDKYE